MKKVVVWVVFALVCISALALTAMSIWTASNKTLSYSGKLGATAAEVVVGALAICAGYAVITDEVND